MHDPQHAKTILRIGQGTDVYVGCAPRLRRCGHRQDLVPAAIAWVDCDTAELPRAHRF